MCGFFRLLVAGGSLNFENLLWHEKVTGVSYMQILTSKKQEAKLVYV